MAIHSFFPTFCPITSIPRHTKHSNTYVSHTWESLAKLPLWYSGWSDGLELPSPKFKSLLCHGNSQGGYHWPNKKWGNELDDATTQYKRQMLQILLTYLFIRRIYRAIWAIAKSSDRLDSSSMQVVLLLIGCIRTSKQCRKTSVIHYCWAILCKSLNKLFFKKAICGRCINNSEIESTISTL